MASLYRVSQLEASDFEEVPVPFCGGALVNVGGQVVVVTAGHCIASKSPRNVRVVLDLYTVEDKRTSALTAVALETESFILHPAYDDHPKQPDGDIGLIILSNFNDSANALNLPLSNYSTAQTEHLLISGWGRLGRSSLQPQTLQVLSGLSSDDTCTWLHGDDYLVDHVCLRDRNGTRYRWSDICRGDSGSPLVDTERRLLIGVASFGTCLGIPASVFTRVSFYADWIKQIMRSISSP
ncbi:Granzyme H [Halotydeus destructor]|nr:Granzyme H [Halotydeus destructor]